MSYYYTSKFLTGKHVYPSQCVIVVQIVTGIISRIASLNIDFNKLQRNILVNCALIQTDANLDSSYSGKW